MNQPPASQRTLGAFCGGSCLDILPENRNAQNLRHRKQGRESPGNGVGCFCWLWRIKAQIKQMLPPVRSCVRLWWKGQHPGTLRKLLAMCSPCGQRLARTFGGDIFRGKTAWAAVPEQQFCGSNPTISASRKKYRRKNRRFCGAGSLTTARSAGSCGVLKGRCSAHEIVALTLFSVEFGCLLRVAKSCWGVPGLFGHEYPSQELRY